MFLPVTGGSEPPEPALHRSGGGGGVCGGVGAGDGDRNGFFAIRGFLGPFVLKVDRPLVDSWMTTIELDC